ncbi:MAG TPA: ion channel [Polyangium sp.]|nr:ion channel [Polyangium sp.]
MTTLRPDPDRAALTALAQIAEGLLGSRGGQLGYDTWKAGFREIVQRDPIDTLIVSVFGGAYLFWLAEKDVNPKCRSFWDAAVFVATSLSVGYDNKFAETEAGKAIATFLMTFGPAVAAAALAPPAAEQKAEAAAAAKAQAESLELQKAILAKLEAILVQLEKEPRPAGA